MQEQDCINYNSVIEGLEKELRQVEGQRNDLITTLRVLRERSSGLPQRAVAPTVAPTVAPVSAPTEPFAGVEIDLAEAKNLGERLVRIAIAVGEPIDALDVTKYLVARGYSKSIVRHLRPHVYNTLNDHPDFEKVGRGLFKYLPNREKVTPATSILPESMVQ